MVKIKADLHNHLKTHRDISDIKFNEVVDKAAEKLGPECILGVVSYQDDGHYEQLVNQPGGYDRQNHGNAVYVNGKALIMRGYEFPVQQYGSIKELLVLGLKEGVCIKPNRGLEDSLKEVRDLGAIAIAPHGFYYAGLGEELKETRIVGEDYAEIPKYFRHTWDIQAQKTDKPTIHAIEINAQAGLFIPFVTPWDANGKAMHFFNRIKPWCPETGVVFNTDGHSVWEIGTSYTALEIPSHAEIKDMYDLNDKLKKAIASHRDLSGKMGSSRIGALIHMAHLMPSMARQFVKEL